MKSLLVVIVLILVGIAGLGFNRGWFNLSSDSTNEKPSATLVLDKNKMHADEAIVKEKLQGFGDKAKETTSDLTAKAKHPADQP